MSAEVGDCLVEALLKSQEIGVILGDRIYPQVRVQDDPLPGLVYSFEGQSRPITNYGDMKLRNEGWQIICYALEYDELQKLEAAVAATLSALTSQAVREILIAGGHDDYEDETNTHARVIDLSVKAWSRG